MALLLPPGGIMDVVFTLDTTGSMSQALDEVKGRVSDMMQRLLADIPGIKMAAVAHGDYCDEHVFYLTQMQNLTSNLPELVNFVTGIEGTGGGDTAECYELVLKLVREDMRWTTGSQRIVVMIGDAYPHTKDDPENRDGIDWEEQVRLLTAMGVKIYGVQVFEDEESSSFFSKLSDLTGGQHLKLTQFGHLCDVIMAICYREKGAEFLENFQVEVQEREKKTAAPNPDLEGIFDVLRRGNSTSSVAEDVEMMSADSREAPQSSPSVSDVTPSGTSSGADVIPDLTSTKSPAGGPALFSLSSSASKGARHCAALADDDYEDDVKPSRPSSRPKLRREKVSDNHFRFRDMKWSPWQLLVVPAPQEVTSGQWRPVLAGVGKLRQDLHYVSMKSLRKGRVPSLFLELAVQTRSKQKRHVVWRRVITLYARPFSFARLLTAGRYVRMQLERVLHQGCLVFTRAAVVGNGPEGERRAEEVEREARKVYDYAWCPARAGRHADHRRVSVVGGRGEEDMIIAGPEED